MSRKIVVRLPILVVSLLLLPVGGRAGDSLQAGRGIFLSFAGGNVVAASSPTAPGRLVRGAFGYAFGGPISVGLEVMSGRMAIRPLLLSGWTDVDGDFGGAGLLVGIDPFRLRGGSAGVELGVGLSTLVSTEVGPFNGSYVMVGVRGEAELFQPVSVGGGVRYTRSRYHVRGGGPLPEGVSPDSRLTVEVRLGIALGELP